MLKKIAGNQNQAYLSVVKTPSSKNQT